MELQEISRDAVNSRLRDKSAIYKNISMTHNKNNVAVMKKLVYIRYQNKYMELFKKFWNIIEPEELEKAINDDSDKILWKMGLNQG